MGNNLVSIMAIALPAALVLMGVQLLMTAVPVSLLLKNPFVRAWRIPRAVRWVIVQAAVNGGWIALSYLCGSALNGLAGRAGGF